MKLTKTKRAELKALAEKDRAKTLDYLAWEGYGLASRQALPDALADIEELEALILDGGVKRLHDAKLALESKLADAVKALEDIKANGYGAWVEPTLAKLRAK